MSNLRIKKQFWEMEIKGLFKRVLHKNHFLGKGKIFIGDRCDIYFSRGSIMETNGNLFLGSNDRYLKSGVNSRIRLSENSTIKSTGNVQIYYGADIVLFEGASLEIGNSYINSNCKIRVEKSVTIGDNCAISHDFTIMDSNFHKLDGEKNSSPVTIGDHVWIGSRVTILPGVSIGNGSVIMAGSVVTKNVDSATLVGGVPASVIKESIEWSE